MAISYKILLHGSNEVSVLSQCCENEPFLPREGEEIAITEAVEGVVTLVRHIPGLKKRPHFHPPEVLVRVTEECIEALSSDQDSGWKKLG